MSSNFRGFADLGVNNSQTNEDWPVLYKQHSCGPLYFSTMYISLILLGVPPLRVYNQNTVGEYGDF